MCGVVLLSASEGVRSRFISGSADRCLTGMNVRAEASDSEWKELLSASEVCDCEWYLRTSYQ